MDLELVMLLGLASALVSVALLTARRLERSRGRPVPAPPLPAAGTREVASPRQRALRPDEIRRFRRGWRAVQALATTRPAAAVADADRLVTEVVRARGLDPVELARIMGRIREHQTAAHRIALLSQRGAATLDDLRDALEHYRAIFDELLDEQRAKTA